jgi:hypothetical protein
MLKGGEEERTLWIFGLDGSSTENACFGHKECMQSVDAISLHTHSLCLFAGQLHPSLNPHSFL